MIAKAILRVDTYLHAYSSIRKEENEEYFFFREPNRKAL